MSGTATTRLSLRLPGLVESIDHALTEIAGKRLSFVLLVEDDAVVQFGSNGDQPAGGPLDMLLKRLDADRAATTRHSTDQRTVDIPL